MRFRIRGEAHGPHPDVETAMYLTGLTHRDQIFDLTVRWLNDDFHEGDGRVITAIVLYEGFISGSFII